VDGCKPLSGGSGLSPDQLKTLNTAAKTGSPAGSVVGALTESPAKESDTKHCEDIVLETFIGDDVENRGGGGDGGGEDGGGGGGGGGGSEYTDSTSSNTTKYTVGWCK